LDNYYDGPKVHVQIVRELELLEAAGSVNVVTKISSTSTTTIGMNGYKLIYGGYARHCRDLDEAARHLLDAREKGREARFRVCESLTRDRQPTVEEMAALVDVATRLVVAS
jgi:hypothetical protein